MKHGSLSAGWYKVLALALYVTDRFSKWYALNHFAEPVRVNQFLSFELTFNRGISWGLFHSDNMITFGIVTLLIFAVTIGVYISAVPRYHAGHLVVGELLVVIGSFSNIMDRLTHGGVIDFILLSYGDWHWPVFNIADMAIVLGVGLMIWEYYRS